MCSRSQTDFLRRLPNLTFGSTEQQGFFFYFFLIKVNHIGEMPSLVMMTLPLSLSPLEVLLIPCTNKMADVHSLHIVDRCFYHSGRRLP